MINSIHIQESLPAFQVMNQPWPEKIGHIAIIGASGSGKTTVLQAVRNAGFTVPKRYITRPTRLGDDLEENVCVTKEEFAELQAQGALGLVWQKNMEQDRVEQYGFAQSEAELTILAGNNALWKNREKVQPAGALRNTLWIKVVAPLEVRAERLQKRSPDLFADKPEEAAFRVGESADELDVQMHLVLNNYGQFESEAAEQLVKLITFLASK